MIEAVGFVVLKLVRTHIGHLSLEGLQVGQYRDLSATEISALRSRSGRNAAGPQTSPKGH
jgi:16S rRNA U516 pseudouridylate synthase RsuA-like enzyme